MSNGANIVLEQAAARLEASVFLRPAVMALVVDFVDVVDCEADDDGDDFVRPPRGMVLACTVLDDGTTAALLVVMLNNLAETKTDVSDESRRNSEKRRDTLILDEMVGLFTIAESEILCVCSRL